MTGLTGLFLGAGASHYAGMPLAWELTEEIKNWLTPQKIRELNAGWRLQGGGHSDEVINDFIGMLERPSVHYEAMLGYIQTQSRRHRTLRQDYYNLYSWLVELVYCLLYYRQINNSAYLARHISRYDGLRSLVEANHTLWVFSLNHDVMIEAIAARLSIPLYGGFSSKTITLPRRDKDGVKTGELTAEVLRREEIEKGPLYFPNPLQHGIYLLKIHGALDIFTFNEGQDLLKIRPLASSFDGVIAALRAANEDLLYATPAWPGGQVKTTNEINYADDEGEIQFLRRSLLAGAYKFDGRDHQVLPMKMLAHFQQNINFVTNLVCIGYSFGDVHINSVLRQWLEFSAQRRLEIVDPFAKGVPSFLLHLSPQVSVAKNDATDYLDAKAGIERSNREKLEKRVVLRVRSFGQSERGRWWNAFLQRRNQRMSEALLAKLKTLPATNGKPDLSSIADPVALAKQWAEEAKSGEEDILDALASQLDQGDEKTRT
jgi:hypothetical protein